MHDVSLLSLKIVSLYDYAKTKENIDQKMRNFEIDTYKYSEITPPTITPNYDVKYEQYTVSKIDKVGSYVEKKLDKLQEVNEFYSQLSIILKRLTKEERIYFCDTYFNKKSEAAIREKLYIGSSTLTRIKESCIIKVALFFDKAVEVV